MANRKPQKPLSPREMQIAKLVAGGLTDNDVGARLGISPNTVRVHLTAIFDKLGLDNRVQLTLWIERQRRSGTEHRRD